MEIIILKIFIFGAILCIASALQLEGLLTKKPKSSKYTIKPTGYTTPLPATSSIYRINGTNGATCILIRTDALLSIQYRNFRNEDREADTFLPDHPELSGNCDEDESDMTLKFYEFVLSIYFKKTPGGERWYITNVELSYNSSNKLFEHIDRPGLKVKLSTPPHSTLLFPTPVGKSYECDQERIITMFAQDENDVSGHLAKLYLRDLRMQSFMFKANNMWGQPFKCSATGSYRDETAPLFVGMALAFAAVCTVTGYGIWRYYKVKKVQYGTMQ